MMNRQGTINKQRMWVGTFVALVFAAGVSTGLLARDFFASKSFAFDGRPVGPPMGPLRLVALMDERLALSSEQRVQIERVLMAHRERVMAVQREMRHKFGPNVEELDKEIKRILTAGQREEFNRILEDERKRFGLPRGFPAPAAR